MTPAGCQSMPTAAGRRCSSGSRAGKSVWVLLLFLVAMSCVRFKFQRFFLDVPPKVVMISIADSATSNQQEQGNHSFLSARRPLLVLYDLEGSGRDVSVRVINKQGRHVTCTFTGNSSMYNETLAAVFHDDTPLDRFPKHRAPHQKWVMRTMETPLNTVLSVTKRVRMKQSRALFNITSTYASHSDVPTPYFDGKCGGFIDNQTVVTPDESGEPIAKLVKGKSRPAAWFVTHCWTSSRRERYVSQLQRYIDVDVYGKCGKYRCSIEDPVRCLDMLERRYFFYLSFENSLCVDYITEKFWRLLNRNVIAVVLGAANYSNLVPPETYLDVRNFRSPSRLAARMRELMADGGALYKQMLSRKRSMKCTGTSDYGGNAFAERLCQYLDENRGQRQITNLDDSWNVKKMCSEPRMFFRGVADSIAN